jgi:hypothetical protein
MPSQVQRSRDALARLVAQGAGATQVGEALLATLATMQQALTPIVGIRGVAALYQRALHLTSRAHPTLATLSAGAVATMDLAALQAKLGMLDAAAAAAAGDALVANLREVLASLVGAPLTTHLLGPDSLEPIHGGAVQDT